MHNSSYIAEYTVSGIAWLVKAAEHDTVEPLFNTIVFHQNTHKRHPIARP